VSEAVPVKKAKVDPEWWVSLILILIEWIKAWIERRMERD
jgi:hypothetical protein